MPRPKKKWAPRQERKKARSNQQTQAQAAPFDSTSGVQVLPQTLQTEVWAREGHKIGGQSKKRARGGVDDELDRPPKSKRSRNAQDAEGDSHPEVRAAAAAAAAASAHEMPFYGLLNQEEQDYFSRANEMLEVNQFGSDEDRSLFIANVFREAKGKELKMACSSAASKLMERLILLSSPAQMKDLFGAFNGHFLNLVRHRFASHCCETLLLQAAPVVSEELTAPLTEQASAADGELLVSMENLFLHAFHELHGHAGHLLTDPYASHTLRVLLTVLSGLPLARVSTSPLMKQKNKEDISVSGLPKPLSVQTGSRAHCIPSSFPAAVGQLVSDAVADLSPADARALAVHPAANPVLQLMAELESMEPWKSNVTAKHSLLQKLLARGPSSDQAEEEDVSFVHGLLYHPSGSHLLEAIIRFAPGKVFRNIYRNMLREKLAEAAKNDVANFVVIRVLERVGKDELQDVINMLLPVFPELARRSRSAVIRAVIERCVARKLDLDPVAKAIESAYEGQSASEKLGRMLKWEGGAAGPKKKDDSSGDNNNGGGGSKHTDTLSLLRNPQPPPGRLHGSLLAQTMLHQPGALSSFVCEGLLDTPTATLADMAEDAAASRLLQAALVLPTPTVVPTAPTMAARASAAPPPPAPAFRRRLLAAFVGVAARLALHPVGWHVLDAMWESTRGLPHCRERIAHELLAQQAALGASFTGRRVWRVWQMNLFRERRARWMALAKTGGEGGAAGGGGGGGGGGRGGDGGGGGRGGGERGAANGQERNGTMRRGRK